MFRQNNSKTFEMSLKHIYEKETLTGQILQLRPLTLSFCAWSSNSIGVDFWSIFDSEESLIVARNKIEKFLTSNNKSGNHYLRANGYLSALRHLKGFLDLKHQTYIYTYEEKSATNYQSQPYPNVSKSWIKRKTFWIRA